jgi:phosphatidylglycerophosphate synthase
VIDGLFKRYIDPLWESAATPLVRAGATPNQVTFAGVLLVSAASAAFVWHQSPLAFGVTLAVSFAFDALDGAVARRRNMRSLTGGYFDAMADRYQELAVFLAIGHVTGLWLLCLLAFSGGIITSYAKARTAIEIPVTNDAWPDLFERLERIIFLCALLIVAGLVGSAWLLAAGLCLYALLAHATSVQRMARAVRMLRAADRRGPSDDA